MPKASACERAENAGTGGVPETEKPAASGVSSEGAIVERQQFRLGFVGFGEVGSSFAKGLNKEGLTSMVAYDIASFDQNQFGELIRGRAKETNVELVRSPEELAKKADVIIAVVPGSETVKAASAIADSLNANHIYVDLAASTPGVKERVGEVLAKSGALLGDGGIMSFPLQEQHRCEVAGSGPAAQKFHDLLEPWGARFWIFSEKLGAGSGLKIVRSIFAKGTEALLHEMGICAERYGIQDEVFKTIANWIDCRPFMELANLLITTGMIHDKRRSEEAEMSAQALEEAGIEPIMTRATARRLRLNHELGLKEHFGGVVPDSYKVAL